GRLRVGLQAKTLQSHEQRDELCNSKVHKSSSGERAHPGRAFSRNRRARNVRASTKRKNFNRSFREFLASEKKMMSRLVPRFPGARMASVSTVFHRKKVTRSEARRS